MNQHKAQETHKYLGRSHESSATSIIKINSSPHLKSALPYDFCMTPRPTLQIPPKTPLSKSVPSIRTIIKSTNFFNPYFSTIHHFHYCSCNSVFWLQVKKKPSVSGCKVSLFTIMQQGSSSINIHLLGLLQVKVLFLHTSSFFMLFNILKDAFHTWFAWQHLDHIFSTCCRWPGWSAWPKRSTMQLQYFNFP